MSGKNVAVVGCGYWGKNLVRNFHDLGALKAVCDTIPAHLEAARKIAPEAQVLNDFEAILNDPDIDGIALATPAVTHRDLAIRAIQAKKDVLVEKPMAMSTGQGREMILEAETHNRILMVGHLLEYHPAIVTLKQLIRNGVLGKLRYVYSNRLNFGKIRREENALWSFAPHDVAVLLRIVGSTPVRVNCQASSYLNPEVADVTMSNLDFPDNIHGHIFVSWLNPFKEQRLVVIGDEKMAVFNDMLKERKLVLYDQHVRVTDTEDIPHKKAEIPVEISSAEPLREECREFLECIRTRRRPLTDGVSGLEVLKVLESCQKSIHNHGLPVDLT